MAILFAEGFTGSPLAAPNNWSTNTLRSLGWTLSARYNGANATPADDGNVVINVEADPVFADRRQIVMRKGAVNSAITLVEQIVREIPALANYQKYVVGVLGMFTTTLGATGDQFMMVVGGTTLQTNSTAAPPADTLGSITFPASGVSVVGKPGDMTTTFPGLKRGQFFHVEFLVEKDVNRTRMYIDGTLAKDWSAVPTLTGIGLSFYIQSAQNGIHDAKWSNLYVVGLDSVHTGVFGPSTRVLEVAPTTDLEVQFDRPDGYASNAAVLSQLFNVANPAYLTAGDIGKYDVYNAPAAISANAAKVYGAGFKINAMTMAEGTHTVKPVVKNASGVVEVGSELALTFNSLQIGFMDMSVNPATSALWTPSQIASVGFGIKLKK